jgi:hemerythrin
MFVEEVSKIKKEFYESGATASVAIKLSQFCGNWIMTHIKKKDNAYCAFIKTRVCQKI